MLVERFVRAVVEDGVEVDSILAITFTEKAAAELRTRVHRRFLDYELPERARDAEAAWISTIHGFCARVLRTHALSAGLDPELRVLDGLEAERVAIDAFDRALGDFLRRGRGSRAPAPDRRLHPRPAGRHGPHRLLAPAQPRRSRTPTCRRSTRRARPASGPRCWPRRAPR